MPDSLRINVNGIVYYPRPSNGFRLEGRTLRVVDPTLLKVVLESLSNEGVTVEYLRHPAPDGGN